MPPPDILAMTERQQIAYLLATTATEAQDEPGKVALHVDVKRGKRSALQQLPTNGAAIIEAKEVWAPEVRVAHVQANVEQPSSDVLLHLVCGGPGSTKLAPLNAFKKSVVVI